jgi:competence/damage-inducible protein CinA-like protein
MPSAEIITIGTEILLGEIVDTNAQYIARKLRDLGIDLYRKSTVGDNTNRISQAIQQAMERSEIVLTTGGLGPTVDDPTREAVAQAAGKTLEFRPELWDQIQSRFERFGRKPTDNNKRQAYIPEGAQAIENPVGTAPAFIVEGGDKIIISLPGVPREMEYLMEQSVLPYLKARYALTGLIKTRILHTVGVGESQIDDLIGDLETLNNPTVGLAAHSGQVDIRITVKADSEGKADEKILEIERELRHRLGDWIYGADQETLEEAALQALKQKDWSLAVVEHGLGGRLVNRLSSWKPAMDIDFEKIFKGGEVLIELSGPEELLRIIDTYRKDRQTDACLGTAIFYGEVKQVIHLVLVTPDNTQHTVLTYGGPPEYAPRYAVHLSLDVLRKLSTLIE